jgi:DNA-binding MarR family transcriptional regulator
VTSSSRDAVSAEKALDDLLATLQRGDLSPRELRMLLSLAGRDATQSDLAEDLDVSRAAIGRASRELAMRGLISRRFEQDRRPRFTLSITAQGLSALTPLVEWIAEAHPAGRDDVWRRASEPGDASRAGDEEG